MILTLEEQKQVEAFEEHYKKWGEQKRQTWRYFDSQETAYPDVGYPPIPTPADNVVWGVDMSGYWNGIADWQVAADTGCKFAIIKAVDGTVITKNFYENAERAMKAGLVVGAYFWLYRNVRLSGNLQANAWWNAVKSLGLQILMIDFEWTWWGGALDNPSTNDLYGAAIPLEALSGMKPMIYSAPGYLAQYFNHDPMWAAYPFCIAHYGVLKPASVVPWYQNWKMWQLTDRWPGGPLGLDPRVSTASDGDIYNGTEDQFNQEYEVSGGSGTMTQIIQGTVLGTVKIRNAPQGAEFVPPRYLVNGDKIEASENSAQWLHLTKVNGNPVTDPNEWASAGSSQQYISWKWVDVVVPPPPPPPVSENSLDVHVNLNTGEVHIEKSVNGVITQADVTLQ